MEDAAMDTRTKTVMASFLALFGVLALAAWASLSHAEPNRALHGALFGQTE
jgi:hypothetical protein